MRRASGASALERFLAWPRGVRKPWHWRRTSDQPNDTLAEVWTDPANGHWPSRVRLSEPRAEPLELTLQDVRRLP